MYKTNDAIINDMIESQFHSFHSLINCLYYDDEQDEYISGKELFDEYWKLFLNGDTEASDFENYVYNCLDGNGTLEIVERY